MKKLERRINNPFFFSFYREDLDQRHQEVMGAVQLQLETSHHDELNELTASFLAETAIKVETARLETEHDWQQKLDEMREKHAQEVDAITEKMTQVSDEFTLKIFPLHYFFSLEWVSHLDAYKRALMVS